jgi:cellobiose-specific phosphotransferase system component IIA
MAVTAKAKTRAPEKRVPVKRALVKPVKVEAKTRTAVATKASAPTAAAWAEAERDHADPDVRVSDIAKRLGIVTIQLNNEARKRGWPKRPKLEKSTALSTPPPKPIVLVQRVYKTIDSELTKLEAQKGVTSQDRERASRALSQMVNSLEKAVEMQREMTKVTSKGSVAKHKEALAHAEDLRREIAQRLERLQRQRPLSKRSDSAE